MNFNFRNVLKLLTLIFLLNSCDFEKNTYESKKYNNGLEVISRNGLGAKDYIMTNGNGSECGCENLQYGESLELHIDSLYGFTLRENKCYLGASLIIMDIHNNVIMSNPDIFNKRKYGISIRDARNLFFYVTEDAVRKLVQSEYNLECKIWDKIGKGSLLFNFKFKVSATVRHSVQD